MNRGFKKYFKESYKVSYKALKKKDNYFRYVLFMFIDLLSSIFYLIKPITNIAKVRLIKGLKLEKRIVLSKTIEAMDSPKSYWTSIITITMKILMFIGIILIHLVVVVLLALLGYLIYSIIGDSDYRFIIFVFAAPAVVALLLFIIIAKYLTADTAYIVDTNPNLGASKVLYASIASLKDTGKKTLFVNDLVHTLIYLGLSLPYSIISFIVVRFMPYNVSIPLEIFILIAYLLMAFFFIPLLHLSHLMVKVSLFDDIVIDKYTINQRISGIRMIEFNKKAQASLEERLTQVFDNEEDLAREASLYKISPSKEEKIKADEARLEEARKLIEEKLAAQSSDVNIIGDSVSLEDDDLPVEEDKLYYEADSLESDGD